MHLLIVLTYNKRSLRNCKQEQLKLEVAFKAGIDCVYFIENYTAKCSTKCRAVTAIKNNFDTDYTALTIIRQCIEFSTQHRRQSSRKMINLAGQVSETNKEENVEYDKSWYIYIYNVCCECNLLKLICVLCTNVYVPHIIVIFKCIDAFCHTMKFHDEAFYMYL